MGGFQEWGSLTQTPAVPHPRPARDPASEAPGAMELQCPLVATGARSPGGSRGLENRVGGGTSLGFRQERRQTGATRTQGMGQWLSQRPPRPSRPSSIRRDQNSEPGVFPSASPILSPGVGVSSRTGENQVTLMSQNIPFLPSATVSVPAILASVFHLGLWVAPIQSKACVSAGEGGDERDKGVILCMARGGASSRATPKRVAHS